MKQRLLSSGILWVALLALLSGCLFDNAKEEEPVNVNINYKIPLEKIDPNKIDRAEIITVVNGISKTEIVSKIILKNYINANEIYGSIFEWVVEVQSGAEVEFYCTFYVGAHYVTYRDQESTNAKGPSGFNSEELAAFVAAIADVEVSSSSDIVLSSEVGTPEASSAVGTPELSSEVGAPETSSAVGTPELSSEVGAPETSSAVGTPELSSEVGTPETSSVAGTPGTSSVQQSSTQESSVQQSSVQESSAQQSSAQESSAQQSSAQQSSAQQSSSSAIPQVPVTFPAVINFDNTVSIEGQSVTGTSPSTITYVSGQAGQAVSFSDNDDRVSFINSEESFQLQQFSLSAWVKTTESAQAQCIAGNTRVISGISEGFSIILNSSNNLEFTISANNGNHWTSIESPSALIANAWYHVAATYDGTTMALYVDGVLVNSKTESASVDYIANVPFEIGGRDLEQHVHNIPFVGLIDEVTIDNRSWSAQEVADEAGVVEAVAFPAVMKLDGSTVIEGQNVTGTTTGSVLYASGHSGQAMSFSGSQSVAFLGNESDFQLQELTISAWFNTSNSGIQQIISNDRAIPDIREGFSLWLTSNNEIAFSIAGNGGSTWKNAYTGIYVSQNSWYHVAATFDGSKISLFVNGVLEVEVVVNTEIYYSVDVPLIIGGNNSTYRTNPIPFHGLIDEVKVYNTIRTAQEIATEAGFAVPLATINFENNTAMSGLTSTGTVTGTVAYESGKVGQAVSLSGADNYIEFVGVENDFRLPELTVATWFNLGAQNGAAKDLVQNGRALSGVREGWYLFISSNNKLQFSFACQGGNNWCYIETPNAITAGSWQHAAFSYDGTTAKLYLDGELLAERDFSSAIYYNVVVPLAIGGRNATFGSVPSPFNGLIDEVKIYDELLTIEQIQNAAGIAP